MRISISNIAWDVLEDEKIADLLLTYKVDAIDIAPGKYFPNPKEAQEKDIIQVRDYWQKKGIALTGMQSLLFGTQGLNVFGSETSQQAMLDHLSGIFRIAGMLGAKKLVFGSPKNRDRSGLSDQEAEKQAVKFFRSLGDRALQHGVIICLEPNPVCYGTNFMTTSMETLHVVKLINHPAIKMQLDTGAIATNHEDINTVLNAAHPHIGHIHISEPNLAVIGSSNTNHHEYHHAIMQSFHDPLVCIEMVATKDESHLASVEKALKFVNEIYRK